MTDYNLPEGRAERHGLAMYNYPVRRKLQSYRLRFQRSLKQIL